MDGGLRSDADGWPGDAARSHEETADCPPFGNFLCYLSLSLILSLFPSASGLHYIIVNGPLKKGPMAISASIV